MGERGHADDKAQRHCHRLHNHHLPYPPENTAGKIPRARIYEKSPRHAPHQAWQHPESTENISITQATICAIGNDTAPPRSLMTRNRHWLVQLVQRQMILSLPHMPRTRRAKPPGMVPDDQKARPCLKSTNQ